MITPAIAPMTAPPASNMLSRPAFETGSVDELGAEVAAPADWIDVTVEDEEGVVIEVAELVGGVDVAPAPTRAMEVPEGGVVVPFPATMVMASVYPTSDGLDSEATTIVSAIRHRQKFPENRKARTDNSCAVRIH